MDLFYDSVMFVSIHLVPERRKHISYFLSCIMDS